MHLSGKEGTENQQEVTKLALKLANYMVCLSICQTETVVQQVKIVFGMPAEGQK